MSIADSTSAGFKSSAPSRSGRWRRLSPVKCSKRGLAAAHIRARDHGSHLRRPLIEEPRKITRRHRRRQNLRRSLQRALVGRIAYGVVHRLVGMNHSPIDFLHLAQTLPETRPRATPPWLSRPTAWPASSAPGSPECLYRREACESAGRRTVRRLLQGFSQKFIRHRQPRVFRVESATPYRAGEIGRTASLRAEPTARGRHAAAVGTVRGIRYRGFHVQSLISRPVPAPRSTRVSPRAISAI